MGSDTVVVVALIPVVAGSLTQFDRPQILRPSRTIRELGLHTGQLQPSRSDLVLVSKEAEDKEAQIVAAG